MKHVLHDQTMQRMQEICEQLKAMPQLPPAQSKEALAMHEEWMAGTEAARNLLQKAKDEALCVLPEDISKLLMEIYDAWWATSHPKQEVKS